MVLSQSLGYLWCYYHRMVLIKLNSIFFFFFLVCHRGLCSFTDSWHDSQDGFISQLAFCLVLLYWLSNWYIRWSRSWCAFLDICCGWWNVPLCRIGGHGKSFRSIDTEITLIYGKSLLAVRFPMDNLGWNNVMGRLPNSPYFRVFKYVRVVERGWKRRARLGRDAKNTFFFSLASHASQMRLLSHAKPILRKWEKNDCLAVYVMGFLSY